jgi:hypothetical protein
MNAQPPDDPMTTPRYCAHCGSDLRATRRSVTLASLAPWLVTFVAVLATVTIAFSSRTGGGGGGGGAPVAGGDPGTILAPDISSLSPEERVDRLFNRVMSLSAAGKEDSVAFFAPMAVNAIAALVPLSPHRHYDLGLVLLVSGDVAGAQAQADTILAASRTHLLGLALAMRAANAAGDVSGARRLGARFTAALAAERAKGLQEYTDHAPDITDAIEEAAGRRERMVGQRR